MSAAIPDRRVLAMMLMVSVTGCTKEPAEVSPPPIADYRTYEHVPVSVKDAGDNGFALLCKDSPVERRTGYIQVLGADGTPGSRLELGALPTTVENIQFAPEALLYTDFAIAQDGSYYIVGTAVEADAEARLHLVVHHVDPQGNALDEPFRRYLTAHAVVVTNDEVDLRQDLNGLPRQRALCGLFANDDLVVAIRWETAEQAGVRLYRFPVQDNSGTVFIWDHVLEDPADRLQLLACDPATRATALVVDKGAIANHGTEIWTTSPGPADWQEPVGAALGLQNAEPQQLFWDGTSFLIAGYLPGSNAPVVPFVGRGSGGGVVVRDHSGLAEPGRAVTSYCMGQWDGAARMLVQSHEASTLSPYFAGDISSDLSLVDLNGDLSAGTRMPLVPGQGLRAIGAFKKNDKRIIIGSQHPFLNAGYQHTFYLVLQ